jgi:hypothetical protein
MSHNDGFAVAPERRLKERTISSPDPTEMGERRGDLQPDRCARGLLWFEIHCSWAHQILPIKYMIKDISHMVLVPEHTVTDAIW